MMEYVQTQEQRITELENKVARLEAILGEILEFVGDVGNTLNDMNTYFVSVIGNQVTVSTLLQAKSIVEQHCGGQIASMQAFPPGSPVRIIYFDDNEKIIGTIDRFGYFQSRKVNTNAVYHILSTLRKADDIRIFSDAGHVESDGE